MKSKFLIAAALAVVVCAGPLAVAQDEPGGSTYAKIVAAKAESIVSVKYVLKVQIFHQGQQVGEQEVNSEVRGVLLNDRGLVLTSNSSFSPRPPDPRITLKTEPTDLRILFGTEEEEYEARIVARDSNLDFAFIQILDLKDHAVKPVALEGDTNLEIGQELVGVTRLPRGFDNAPIIERLFVNAKVERPRSMWSVSGQFGAIGLPVYDLAGHAVGILSVQHGSEGVEGGGGASRFVLPLSEISRVVTMAEERATEMLSTLDTGEAKPEAGDGEAKPAEEKPVEDKPADDKPAEDKPGEDQPTKDE